MTTTTSNRGRGDGVSKLRAELDRYNNEICAIRSRKHIFESAEDTDNSAWDSAESVAPSLSPPDSPKSVVDRVHNILPANPKACTVHHVFKAFVAGRPGPVGQEAEDGDDDCDSSFEGAVRISATTVFTANGGDFAYRGAAGPRPPKPRVDFGSPREPARELEEGGSPAAEPLEPLPEPFGAKNDDLCNKIVPIRPPAEAPADALVLGIFPSKILESANSLLLGLSNVNCQENSNGDADGGRKADNLNGGDGRSDAGALIVPTEGNADTGNDLDNTIAENREPRPSADGQRQDIYSSKCNSGRDLVVARRMASKIKSILQRVDARIHGSQTQTDAGNYSCRNQHGQSSSFSIGYSQNPNAILKMISDPGSHSILEKTGTSKQHDIPFPDQEWFETQLKDIREKHKSNEIPDPKVYLEHVVASLGGKDQVGYIDQFKCSVTRGISSLMNSNCIKCEPNEGCNICNQQEIELNKSSAIVHDLGKDVPVPALFTDAGHQRLTLEDLKQGEDLESKQVYMQNSSGTLGIHSDKKIQVGRAEVQGNNMTEDGGIQALAIPLQSLQFTTSKQIKDNHASDWVCDGEKRDRDEFHGNDQFLKECRRKVGNLLDGYRLLEKNVGGSKPPWHMQQELRNIQTERKKIEQRVKARPLKLADHCIDMDPMMHNQRGAKDEKSWYLHGTTLESQAQGLGGKHRRSICSPARETHRKFLRSTLGRTQPILGPHGHKSLLVAQPVADGELLVGDIYKKKLMGNDNAEKRELLKTNKHYKQPYIQATNKLQTTGGANGNQEQGIEVPRKNCKAPSWVDRMAKGRSCYEVSEFKHKNMRGNYTMRIPLKRLSVRPPGSIFKSSTIVQWKAEPNVVRKQESWRPVRHKVMKKRNLISLDKQRETVEKSCMDVNTCLKPSKDNVLRKRCLFANNKPPKSHGLKVIKPVNGRSKSSVIQERELEDRSVDQSKSDIHQCKGNPSKIVNNFMGLGKPQTGSAEIDPERKNKLKNGTNKDGQPKEINFEVSAAGDGTENQLLLEPGVMESLAMDILESKLNVCTKQAKEHEDSSLLPESPDSELVVDCNSHENEELQRTLLEIAIQSILKNESLKKVQDDASTCARETETLQHPVQCSNQKGHSSGHGHSCEAIQGTDMHTLASSSFPQSNLPVFFPTYVSSNGHLLPSLLSLHPSSGFSQFSPAVLSPAHVQSQSTPSKVARRPRKIRRSVCKTMDRWNKKRPRRPEECYLSSPTTPSTPLTSPGHEGRIKKVLAPFSELEDIKKLEAFTSTDGLKGISTANILTSAESLRIDDVSTGTGCVDIANDSMVTEHVKPDDAPTKTKGFKIVDASTSVNSINIDGISTATDDAKKMIKDASTKTEHINIAVASMRTENVPLVDASMRTDPVKVADASTRMPDLPVVADLTRTNHEKLTDVSTQMVRASTGTEGVRMTDVSTATEVLNKIIRTADSSTRTDYIKIADASMQVVRKAAAHVATSADDLNTKNRREPSESVGVCGMLQSEGIRPLEVPQRQHSRNAILGQRLLDPKTNPLLRNSGLGMQRSNFQNLNPNIRRKKTGIDPADWLRKKSILRSLSSSDESKTVDSDSTSLTSSSASLGELSSKAYEATIAAPPSLLTQRSRGTPHVPVHTPSVQPYMSCGQSQFPVSQASAQYPSIQARYRMGNSSFRSSDFSEGEIAVEIAPKSEWSEDYSQDVSNGEPGELTKMSDAILGVKEPEENGTEGGDAISICSKSSSAGQRSINDRQSAMKVLHEIFSPRNQHHSNMGQSCSEGEISPGCLSR